MNFFGAVILPSVKFTPVANCKEVEVVVCVERVFIFSSAASIVVAMSRIVSYVKFFSVSNQRYVASCFTQHTKCSESRVSIATLFCRFPRWHFVLCFPQTPTLVRVHHLLLSWSATPLLIKYDFILSQIGNTIYFFGSVRNLPQHPHNFSLSSQWKLCTPADCTSVFLSAPLRLYVPPVPQKDMTSQTNQWTQNHTPLIFCPVRGIQLISNTKLI